jgi:hypothetical protein
VNLVLSYEALLTASRIPTVITYSDTTRFIDPNHLIAQSHECLRRGTNNSQFGYLLARTQPISELNRLSPD